MGINSVYDGGKEENYNMNIMPVSELIDKVEEICKANGVKRLDLFGSFATGTATDTSDIDFVVIRAISDNADEAANISFEQFAAMAAEKSIQLLCEVLPVLV
jgi:predicted nucleotidyltransferase